MLFLLPLLIVATEVPAPSEEQYADTVFRCDFEQEVDANYDHWPDGWKRRRGRGFPHYLEIGIVADQQPEENHALRINLNGGEAIVYSPSINISDMYSYVLEGRLKTEQLRNNVAYFALSFHDEEGRLLETHTSPQLGKVEQWTTVHIGPLTPSHPDARRAVVSLHLRKNGKADLQGAAMFDDVLLGRLPRMTVRANEDLNVFTNPDDVEITCEVSGVSQTNPTLTAELLDVSGNLVASETLTLARDKKTSSEGLTGLVLGTGQGFAGSTTWKPPIQDYGFYRLRVSLDGQADRVLQRVLTVAVMRPQATPKKGEFGWSLTKGEDPFPVQTLLGLLGQVGVNWVKFPVWFDDGDVETAEDLAWFAERLNTQKIEMVGVLDVPPPKVREVFADTDQVSVAVVFVEPGLWHPAVDPVMVRLSLKVRWWQLGSDDDTSFIAFPDLEEKINKIKEHLDQFGRKTKLGVAWRWMYEPPRLERPPWSFLAFRETVPFTPTELQSYVRGDKENAAQQWVTIQPLDRQRYSVEDRARDLVGRMLAAKIEGAEGIFVTDPFNADHGLMNPDGTPGPLLLPWRTTALMVAGSKYVGQIQMPNGSHNYVFARDDGTGLMVIWNSRNVTEKMYLGDNIQQMDLWGQTSSVNSVKENGFVRQPVDVGTLPVFVTGINLPVALWRMQFQFDKTRLASVFGQTQVATYRFSNTFSQGVGGSIRLHTPEVWEVKRAKVDFKLATGDEQVEAVEVLLGINASSGWRPVRVDFDITADQHYRFSAYRQMQVGLGDVLIDLSTHLDTDGNLVVDQHLINKTDRFVSFNCLLLAPNRRRERQQVVNLGRGKTTIRFILPDGEELIGKELWARAEEIGGARLLNYHVRVER